jgi:GT2 family glycosyltransferase
VTPARPTRAAAICVTHNSREAVARCVAPLAADGVRVVVVDSGSTDDTCEVARRLVVDTDVMELGSNFGYAAGINRALAHLAGESWDLVVVVNPDVTVAPGAVARLAAELRRPGVGIAVPHLRDEHGRPQLSLRRRPALRSLWCEALLGGPLAHRLRLPAEVIRDRRAYATGTEAGWATGGMMAISRSCAAATGPWDESFFLYDEEVDFALRAAAAGFGLRYVHEAVAVRKVGTGDAPWAYALMRVNRVSLHRRRSGRLAGAAAWFGMVTGEGLRSLRGRPEARGALRCLLARSSPMGVMHRLGPTSFVAPTTGRWARDSAARPGGWAALSGAVRVRARGG